MIEGYATSIEIVYKDGSKKFYHIGKVGGEFYICDKVLSFAIDGDSTDFNLENVEFVRCFLYSFQVLKVTI